MNRQLDFLHRKPRRITYEELLGYWQYCGGGVVMVVQIFSLFIHCSGYVCFIHFLEWVLYFTNLRTKCKNL